MLDDAQRLFEKLERHRNFITGRFVDASGGGVIEWERLGERHMTKLQRRGGRTHG